jgi:hypothetical protein
LTSKTKKREVNKWSKAHLLISKKYKHQTDVLHAVLKDDEEYTVDQVDNLISKFMKGGAK